MPPPVDPRCRHSTTNSRPRSPGLLIRAAVDFDSLMQMDVVVYSGKGDETTRHLGAIVENSRLAPLSVWSAEPVFGDSLEFLVHQEDLVPGLTKEMVIVHSVVPEEALSYGSRQVGGGKGPGNPHGEESELLYYIDQKLFSLEGVDLSVRPELEITW